MNKFGMVIGVAAVAVIAGCKDPDYKYGGTQTTSQNDVKLAGGDVAKPADIAVTDAPSAKARHCKCAPGTRHTKPCACGAADCMWHFTTLRFSLLCLMQFSCSCSDSAIPIPNSFYDSSNLHFLHFKLQLFTFLAI